MKRETIIINGIPTECNVPDSCYEEVKMEPLKNEVYRLSQIRKMSMLDGSKELVFVPRIQAAIEWLLERTRNDVKENGFVLWDAVEANIELAFKGVRK